MKSMPRCAQARHLLRRDDMAEPSDIAMAQMPCAYIQLASIPPSVIALIGTRPTDRTAFSAAMTQCSFASSRKAS